MNTTTTIAEPSPRIPSRVRDPGAEELIPTSPLFWKLLGARVSATDPRVAALRDAVLETDPVADALVPWFLEGDNRAIFDEALEHGVLGDAPRVLRDFFDDVEREPSWLDRREVAFGAETLLRIGDATFRSLGAASLMSGYLSAGAVKPLAMTGTLVKMAPRRIAETAKFVRDLATSADLGRFSDGFKTTVRVRMMHAVVRRRLTHSPRWKPELWGAPINQRDMVGTHLEFTVTWIAGVLGQGYLLSRREREAVIHLWRYAALLLGIRDDLVPTTFRETLEVAWIFNRTETGPDDDGRALAAALLTTWADGLPGDERGILGRIDGLFTTGYARTLLGERASNSLGLPTTPWRYAAFAMAPAVALYEGVRLAIPGGRARAVRAGRARFDEIASVGLRGQPAEFHVRA